jgi:hypothetical protein
MKVKKANEEKKKVLLRRNNMEIKILVLDVFLINVLDF